MMSTEAASSSNQSTVSNIITKSNTNIACISRINKELEMLQKDPGPGIAAWCINDDKMKLQAQIQGPQESPYEAGVFTLSISIPDRYPFEPPLVRFITPIYHPNIDSDGRICLDTLKMQPQGSWSPSVNINTLLLTIRVLMGNPNADDGLVPHITEEYKRDRNLWRCKAVEFTALHAVNDVVTNIPSTTDNGLSASGSHTVNSVINKSESSSEDDDSDDDEEEEDGDSDDDDIESILNKRNTQNDGNGSNKKSRN